MCDKIDDNQTFNLKSTVKTNVLALLITSCGAFVAMVILVVMAFLYSNNAIIACACWFFALMALSIVLSTVIAVIYAKLHNEKIDVDIDEAVEDKAAEVDSKDWF